MDRLIENEAYLKYVIENGENLIRAQVRLSVNPKSPECKSVYKGVAVIVSYCDRSVKQFFCICLVV